MKKAKKYAQKAAAGYFNVLIEGEAGTGKEHLARAIHSQSSFCHEEFVKLDFGLKANAVLSMGIADTGGTLFLKDINNMPLPFQEKLLALIRERISGGVGYAPFGIINTRVVASSSTRLSTLVDEGKFNKDLYYFLRVIRVCLPPLRDRKEDIMMLANFFIYKYGILAKKTVRGLTSDGQELVLRYPWPGNVDELEDRIKQAVSNLAGTWITAADMRGREIIQRQKGI